MNLKLIKEIEIFVNDMLIMHPKRLKHIYGVSETAYRLAAFHGIDPIHAKVAGLLHDCTKKWSIEKHLGVIDTRDLDEFIDYPFFYHGLSAAQVAKDQFNIVNHDLLNSIKYHSTGRKNMSLLEQIILISDMAEPNRPWFDASLFQLACTHIDLATLQVLEMKKESNIEDNHMIHPNILDAIAYYKELTWKT
jgi:nicotinate-nucleotide adenylyltransferase